jgi:hypothetical protein
MLGHASTLRTLRRKGKARKLEKRAQATLRHTSANNPDRYTVQQRRFQIAGVLDNVLNVRRPGPRVQRKRAGQNSDQDQHNQAHAFLAVVRSVEEADAGTRQHQQAANPHGRRFSFGRFVQFGFFDERFEEQQQKRRAHETHDGRNE